MTEQAERNYRRLSTLAEQAEQRYYATCVARTGRQWFALTPAENRIPEIVDAFRAKRNADEALLMFIRTGGTV